MYTTKNYQKAIAEVCKNTRVRSGLSQSDVANATGYTQPQISRFESGKMASFYLLIYYLISFDLDLRGLKYER